MPTVDQLIKLVRILTILTKYYEQKMGLAYTLLHKVGIEEELLLSNWDKDEPPRNNFDNETSSSNQENMENNSRNSVSSPLYEYPYQTITVYEIFVFFVKQSLVLHFQLFRVSNI